MRTPVTVLVCSLSVLLLGACEPDRSAPPVPRVEPVRVETGSTQQGATNTSVPAAESVFSPAAVAPTPTPTAVRTNKALTRAEEANAMPIAGQANDHSAPTGAARRASAP